MLLHVLRHRGPDAAAPAGTAGSGRSPVRGLRSRMLRAVTTVAVVVGAATALAGCVKLKQHTKVMADGSGRFRMTMGISKTLADGFTAATNEDGKAQGPFDALKDPADFCEGYVAASPLENYEKDGFSYVAFTLWCDDVNRLRVRSPKGASADQDSTAGADETQTFRFERAREGFTLRVSGGPMSRSDKDAAAADDDADLSPEMKKAAEEMAKAMAEAMKAMMKGLEISETWELPGDVTEAEGLPDRSGRTATLRVTEADLSDVARFEKLTKTAGRTIRCGPANVSAAEIAEFRAEMDAAKADFARRVAAGRAKPAPAGTGAEPKPAPDAPPDEKPAPKDPPKDDGTPGTDAPKKPRVTIRRKGE